MDAEGRGGFRDPRVWQEAIALSCLVFDVAGRLPARYASLADQLLRAAASIHANIAEGAGHRSRREFGRFLRIAEASLAELESHTAFLQAARLMTAADARRLTDGTRRVHQLLRGLQRALTAPQTGPPPARR